MKKRGRNDISSMVLRKRCGELYHYILGSPSGSAGVTGLVFPIVFWDCEFRSGRLASLVVVLDSNMRRWSMMMTRFKLVVPLQLSRSSSILSYDFVVRSENN